MNDVTIGNLMVYVFNGFQNQITSTSGLELIKWEADYGGGAFIYRATSSTVSIVPDCGGGNCYITAIEIAPK